MTESEKALALVDKLRDNDLPFETAAALVLDFDALYEALRRESVVVAVGISEPSALTAAALLVLRWCRPDLVRAEEEQSD
jgi:hypothetical protein